MKRTVHDQNYNQISKSNNLMASDLDVFLTDNNNSTSEVRERKASFHSLIGDL